jgi:hypothetical protein
MPPASAASSMLPPELSTVPVARWTIPQLLNHLIEAKSVQVHVQYVHDNWMDIDDISDLSDLYKF